MNIKQYFIHQTGELISVNAETGEVVGEVIKVVDVPADEPAAPARHYIGKHFWKLYLKGFLSVLDGLKGKQIKVLIYILEHIRSSDNHFLGTYQSISKHCDLSLDAVRRTMLRLQETGFLIKEPNSNYFISPRILVKGDDNKRKRLKKQFREAEQEKTRDKDRYFWRLYMSDFLAVLDKLEGKQINVLVYILENTHSADNHFSGTYRSISEHCKISMDTVRRTMLQLQKVGFLVKVQNGNYFISPSILVKGNDHKKAELERQFRETGGERESHQRKKEQHSKDRGSEEA